jgi:hypothetical protein
MCYEKSLVAEYDVADVGIWEGKLASLPSESW